LKAATTARRAGKRSFWLLSTFHTHTSASYKTVSLRRTLRPLEQC
jgi:hypothetical protein